MTEHISIPPAILAAYCRRHHIRRLALFGSVLKDTARPDSDIDLLVEFEPGHEPGYIGLAAMQLELSDLMGGRPVDLRTPAELSRYFRDDVLATAHDIYSVCHSAPKGHPSEESLCPIPIAEGLSSQTRRHDKSAT